ncbi:MAG: hypothetical protein IPO00_01520 [Betaproteobacteria bacterium]|nr:hypothetical protein [Betaproteobacteria bacterium]
MKKALVAIGIIAFLVVAAKFVGERGGTISAIQSLQQEADAQKMPREFFGVKWLASLDDIKRLRPTIQQESQELFSEQVIYGERNAKMTYYVKNNSTLMFIVTFADLATMESFNATQAYLNKNYGTMSDIASMSDTQGAKDCSKRVAGRFRIDHCMRKLDSKIQEQIIFYRTSKG